MSENADLIQFVSNLILLVEKLEAVKAILDDDIDSMHSILENAEEENSHKHTCMFSSIVEDYLEDIKEKLGTLLCVLDARDTPCI